MLKSRIDFSGAKSFVTGYFLLLMFGVFPLFFTDRYSNIRHDKYSFFLATTAALTVAGILCLVLDRGKIRDFLRLSVTDISLLSLLVVMTVSTLLSDHSQDSFTGNQGRNCGLLLYIAFLLCYFFVSRFYEKSELVFIVFAASSAVVFALCILNFFGLDPLNMYADYPAYVRDDFTSTIGNKNLMSCFCCLCVPAFLVLFFIRKTAVRFFYLFVCVLGFAALICADSSSGILGIVPTLAFALLYRFRANKKLFRGLIIALAAALLCLCIAFCYFTFFDVKTPLGGFFRFFRFNAKWGTHRGYIWLKSFEIFKSFGFKNILFGCGPDTFYSAFAPYFSELQRLFGDASANCAHNELLNYLITTGIFGLSAYLALISSAVLRGVKRAEKSPEVLIFTLPIICCFCQSLVNIATPITTPLLFIFIALAENSARKT